MAGVGLLNVGARAQYAAMTGLRWRMFINSLRSKLGAVELGARTVAFVIYAAMGLGLGAGMGVGAFAIAFNEKWQLLPILFWVAFLLWQVIPVMLASFQEQFDLGILLRFPVSFGSFFLLYVVFGLADVSTILGVLCCLGIWTGITLARPDLFAWAALGLVLFAAFNILLVRAVFAWIDRWLAQRKTREILGVVFMMLILSMQLLNPALHQMKHSGYISPQQRAESYRQTWIKVMPWVKSVDAVQQWLPPGLAGRALDQAARSKPEEGMASLALLGLWGLAAGSVLAGRLRAEYRGENLGNAPSRAREAARRAISAQREGGWRLGGSGPIAAVMEKEARCLMRTLPLLWALGVPVLMVLFIGGLFRGGASGLAGSFFFALPLCVASALMGFTQLFYNNLGVEGAGIQLLFLSPMPIRRVLLAKNLFHALLFGVDALLAGILATLRLGRPDGAIVAVTVAWLLFALPCNLAVGNILSLSMPYRINPGRISRQGGAQANNLLSLLNQLVVLGTGAVVFWIAFAMDNLLLAVPVFLALAVLAGFFWLRVLGNVGDIANQRRNMLIATLMKTQ
jgi:ABC-2 type transport system permease protein